MHYFVKTLVILLVIVSSMRAISDQGREYLFRVQGSNTVGAKLAPECAVDFLRANMYSNVSLEMTDKVNEYEVSGFVQNGGLQVKKSIYIAAHGSSTGFKALLRKTADLAMSSRPIKDKEHMKLLSYGDMRSGDSEHTVAIDGLAILVNKSNPINQLTINQIAQLFSGTITNWSQLGGPDLAVTLYARDDRSGTWDTFKSLVLANKYKLDGSAVRFESNDDLSDSVARNIGGIGFSGLASVRHAKAIAVSDDGTEALLPTAMSVATEDYPLSRRLFFYMPSKRQNPLVESFVRYCQSVKGQDIVSSVGFVSQNIVEVLVEPANHWPEEYRLLADKSKRLSVNFRFSEGSAKIDNKAQADLVRLSDYMADKKSTHEIVLVGFTDANERLKIDRLVSKLRALAVQARLIYQQVSVADVKGLGSFMPVASSGSRSKLKNARVEVWIREKSTF